MADPAAVDYARLREGLCPIHGTVLERREDQGWCEECSMGWSMTPETITAHVDVDFDGLREAVRLTRRTSGG